MSNNNKAIPCPFVYSTGKKCQGSVIRVEAYKADLAWSLNDDGKWFFDWNEPRSHWHLFCSLKGNHSGARGDDALKFYWDQLPEELRQILSETK